MANKSSGDILEQLGFTTEEVLSHSLNSSESGGEDNIETVSTTEELVEASFDYRQAHDIAKESLDFLASIAMPTIFQYCYPPVFQSVWNWLLSYAHKERDFSKLAIGLPRGFGKTTLMKIFILYCILFTSKRFILIVGSTATMAQNILADVMDMLEEPNIKKIFGDWKLGAEKDTQDVKKFGFRGRNIILAAMGVGGSLRGLNLKNERPDVMLFEDIQTSEDADSASVSDKIEKWFLGTAMKAKSPKGCLYIFVANMYPSDWSILRRLKKNPHWTKFIAGGILADGTSLWEELQPIEQLLTEYENDEAAGRPEIFHSEVLNDETASRNNLVNLSKLPSYPYEDEEIAAGNFIVIDPATDKVKADYVSIGYFEIIDSKPVLRELLEGRYSPGTTIRHALDFCFKHNCRCVAIESNAYQSTLCYWFNFICLQSGIEGIHAVEIYSGKSSKITRILNMFKSLMAGEILMHPSIVSLIKHQILQFNPMKTDNVDGLLDLLTYAPRVVELYAEFITSLGIIESQEYVGIPLLGAISTSSF